MVLLPILAFIIICLFILEKYSLRNAFKGVDYDIRPSGTLFEADEEFSLITTITNTKRLPLEFLRTGELMPDGITLPDGEFEITPGDRGMAFVSDTYLMPRQKLTRTLKATLPKRGLYYFLGATLTVGSFLGLSEKKKELHLMREVVVPPKPVEVKKLNNLLGKYIGDISVYMFLLEDPILTIGFRDYTERDPMRSICWKQTARSGKLMVKNFDHTLDLTATVILNLDSKKADGLETVFSMARTVCEFLEGMEISYRFVTNASVARTMGRSVIYDGFGGDHFASILELLGRVTYTSFESLQNMLAKIVKGAEPGRSHILLTPEITDTDSLLLHRLRVRTGREALVLTPETLKDETEVSQAV